MVSECHELRLSAKERCNSAAIVIAAYISLHGCRTTGSLIKTNRKHCIFVAASYWPVQNQQKKKKKPQSKSFRVLCHTIWTMVEKTSMVNWSTNSNAGVYLAICLRPPAKRTASFSRPVQPDRTFSMLRWWLKQGGLRGWNQHLLSNLMVVPFMTSERADLVHKPKR